MHRARLLATLALAAPAAFALPGCELPEACQGTPGTARGAGDEPACVQLNRPPTAGFIFLPSS